MQAMNPTAPLKLAVSACFFHADPARPIFTGKTLQYIEQSVAQWVMSQGDLIEKGRAVRIVGFSGGAAVVELV